MSGVETAVELTAEDAARASFYALIGRLFFDALDADLLAQIARDFAASDTDLPMGAAMSALGAACRKANAANIADEHLALFVGVGRAIVTPYTSAYIKTMAPDRHLLALRQQMGELGLARPPAATEAEDHVAGVCDVMRHLIARGTEEHVQKNFFAGFLFPGAMPFCEAVLAAPRADFYAHVARLASQFFEVEREAFDMLD